MTGKIFRSCFLVGLAIMVLCTALFVAVMASRYEDQVYQEMEETAVYVKRGMEESGGDYLSGLEDLEGGQRLTWITADGTVLYDSEADPAAMENHADRGRSSRPWRRGPGRASTSPTPSCKRPSTMPCAWMTAPFCGCPARRPPWAP